MFLYQFSTENRMVSLSGIGLRDIFRVINVEGSLHWVPLRRRAAGWPHWSGDVRGRRPRPGSNLKNLSTTRDAPWPRATGGDGAESFRSSPRPSSVP